jgi:hypothetical protein
MMRQPGVPAPAASTLGASVSSSAGALLSPHRLQDTSAAAVGKGSYTGSPARIGAGVAAAVAGDRDISSSDQQTVAL